MVKNNPKMKDITHRFGEIAIAPASVSVYNLQVEECNYYKDRFSGLQRRIIIKNKRSCGVCGDRPGENGTEAI